MNREYGITIGLIVLFTGLGLLYFQNKEIKDQLENLNEYLESGDIVINQYFPRFSILDLVGTTLCCHQYRMSLASKKSWFEVLISCMLMQLGGTTMVGLILGQIPGWMIGSSTFPAVILIWWLCFYCPYDMYWKFINYHPIILFIFSFITVFSCGHATGTWGVDKVFNNTFHINHNEIRKSYFVSILAGTLANCGGGLFYELFSFTKNDSYTLNKSPVIFQIDKYQASKTLNISFLISIIYYCLINKDSFFNINIQLSLKEAHLVIFLIHLFAFLLEQMVAKDMFQLFSTMILRLFNVKEVINPLNYTTKSKLN